MRSLLRKIGLMPVLKFLRKKYFPSPGQKDEYRRLPERKSFYSQFLQKGDLCFDVGANIGDRASIFLSLGAKVVAIEPQTDCVKMLRLRFGNKINVLPVALGENEGQSEIFLSDTSEISSLSKEWINTVSQTRFRDQAWARKETIAVTTLDQVIKTFGIPVFCKIDVEGYEEQVLSGLSRPLKFISFEYTLPERFSSMENCLDQLATLGDFTCNYTIGEQMKFELQHWVSRDQLISEIKKSMHKEIFGDVYVHFQNHS